MAQAPSLFAPLEERRPSGELLSVWEDGGWQSWSWEEWQAASFRFAGGLRGRGVRPGDRVALLLSNSRASCAGVLGCWLAGGCVVSLPMIARGMSVDSYASMLGRVFGQSEPSLVVVDPDHVSLVRSAGCAAPVVSFAEVERSALREPEFPGPDEAVFVQYSSGSTSEPRGCELSARAVAQQLDGLARVLALDPERDVSVDWLPLYHDMGIFGCVLMTAYWTGTRQVLGTPQRFIANPHSWFRDLAEFGATITAGPNFALELAARFASLLPARSIPMRRLVVAGERIRPETLDRASRALGPKRLPWEALLPAYGLAEAVLAVTTGELGRGPRLLDVDRDELAAGVVRVAQEDEPEDRHSVIVSVGAPLPGNEVEIVGEREVGEVIVRSGSLANGYLGSGQLTRECFTPDGLRTGDIGFVLDGELCITGRTGEVLVLAGRNVYAADIERALVATGAIRPGSCAVVQAGEDSDPRLVAIVEPGDRHPELSLLAERMAAAAREATGVRLAECVFLAPGQFPKTPSGKVQRFRCAELAGERHTAGVSRVVPGRTNGLQRIRPHNAGPSQPRVAGVPGE
jgi:acyl-CoA synthetase (AMP-forming)/AMP-acid ligase II